jgi:hypothetical protein
VLALATACPSGSSGSPAAYARRRPEETLLQRVVSQHWQAFRERAEHAGGLSDFVVDEVQEYLRCGILEHGVVHLACRRCGHALVVGFSCKRRRFCPSCTGRRMAGLAAHLVDEVLPKVALRQWVGSLPWRLRYPMAYDRELCADVLEAFIGALRRSNDRIRPLPFYVGAVDDPCLLGCSSRPHSRSLSSSFCNTNLA